MKTAPKFVILIKNDDLMVALDKMPTLLNMRHLTITEEYKCNILKVRATFLHMVVYDLRQRKQVRLHEVNKFDTDIEYCSNAGKILDGDNSKKALDLAVGNLHPSTFNVLDDWHPNQVRIQNNFQTFVILLLLYFY